MNTKGVEMLEEALETLSNQLESGDFSMLDSYFATIAKFHKYSFHNQLLIACQCPHATHVAGFHAWKALGRWVSKDQKGIMILAPMVGKDKKDPEKKKVFGFTTKYVWDVSQTEGKELPSIDINTRGEVLEDEISILSKYLESAYNIAIKTEDTGRSYGTSSMGTITLNSNLTSTLSVLNTLIHEAAHEILHKKEERIAFTKAELEVEAESVAYTVLTALGYSTEGLQPSLNYIAMYNRGKDVFKRSLNRVRDCSLEIINAIQKEVVECEI